MSCTNLTARCPSRKSRANPIDLSIDFLPPSKWLLRTKKMFSRVTGEKNRFDPKRSTRSKLLLLLFVRSKTIHFRTRIKLSSRELLPVLRIDFVFAVVEEERGLFFSHALDASSVSRNSRSFYYISWREILFFYTGLLKVHLGRRTLPVFSHSSKCMTRTGCFSKCARWKLIKLLIKFSSFLTS